MKNSIKSIYFMEEGFQYKEYFRLLSNIVQFYDEIPCQKEITESEKEQFIDRLYSITNTWNQQYTDGTGLDESQWILQTEFINGESKRFCGMGEKPYNYEMLQQLIRDYTKGN